MGNATKSTSKGFNHFGKSLSTSLYSGMVPGLIANTYLRDALEIDLRRLSDQAGVILVLAEITGVNISKRELYLEDRPALAFDSLSLNVGCVTKISNGSNAFKNIKIKPLEPALEAILEKEYSSLLSIKNIQLFGSGMTGIELSLALRNRWPHIPLQLFAYTNRIQQPLKKALGEAGVGLKFVDENDNNVKSISSNNNPATSLVLHCTGSQGPAWLSSSGLPVDRNRRIRTNATLEVVGHPGLFAAGDCAVIDRYPRPPSGVWAVRAAKHLARNLEAASRHKPLRQWRPQKHAIQLLGGFKNDQRPTAWLLWGPLLIGPHPWLWKLKKNIDHLFMILFQKSVMVRPEDNALGAMLCRGCAAKLSADPLKAALEKAGLQVLGNTPEDANPIPHAKNNSGQAILQSVDGFPALISDPWLNGRLTALHACSDLWACGATVESAQIVVTLPLTDAKLQQELLSQTIAGVHSVLKAQGAQLLGGHTLEARTLHQTAEHGYSDNCQRAGISKR